MIDQIQTCVWTICVANLKPLNFPTNLYALYSLVSSSPSITAMMRCAKLKQVDRLDVNDLPVWIKTNIKMFAGDTKLWSTIQQEADSQELQEDLDKLKEWSNKWLLDANIEECKVMHVGHKLATSYSI